MHRQHSFKLRSTFQELDKEDDLVITTKDLRRGEVSVLLLIIILWYSLSIYPS